MKKGSLKQDLVTLRDAAQRIIDAAPRRKVKGKKDGVRRPADRDDDGDDERRDDERDDKPKRGFFAELWSDDDE